MCRRLESFDYEDGVWEGEDDRDSLRAAKGVFRWALICAAGWCVVFLFVVTP